MSHLFLTFLVLETNMKNLNRLLVKNSKLVYFVCDVFCCCCCLLFSAVHACVNEDKVCFTSQQFILDVLSSRSQQQMEE